MTDHLSHGIGDGPATPARQRGLAMIDDDIPEAWVAYARSTNDIAPWETAPDHEGWSRPTVFGKEYVLYFTTIKLALSADDVREIWQRIISASAEEHDSVSFLKASIDSRLKYFGRWANIVSLGADCLPRTVAARWGLKKPRALGELSHPFDLSVTPLGSVIDILENRFEGFLSDLQYDQQLGFPVHTRHGMWFNHEVGEIWAENDFAKFRERYARRIESFFHALKNGQPTILVFHVPERLEQGVVDLVERAFAACRAVATDQLAMLCVASGGVGDIRLSTPDITICDAAKPFPAYEWWKHTDFISPEGLRFEQKIISSLEQIWLGLNREG